MSAKHLISTFIFFVFLSNPSLSQQTDDVGWQDSLIEKKSGKMIEDLTFQTQSGLPVAASKVYFTDSKFAISGFGEVNHINYQGPVDKSSGDLELYYNNLYRFVSYLAYKPVPWLVLYGEVFAEIFQDLETGETDYEFFPEFFIDFLLDERFNIRAGTSQLHLGFLNNNDEPVMFYSVNRPDVERIILPSTWIDLGVSVYGNIAKDLGYAIGIFQGLDPTRFNGGTWIRAGRDQALRMNFDSFVLNGKLEYKGIKNTELAINGFWTQAGNNTQLNIAGEHTTVRGNTFLASSYIRNSWKNWTFMALGSYGRMDETHLIYQIGNQLNDNQGSILGSEVYGFYFETGYDILSVFNRPNKDEGKSNLLINKKHMKLPIFARYERLNTHAGLHPMLENRENIFISDLSSFTLGANFFSSRNFVFKANYQFRTNFALADGQNEGNRIEFGLGFIF